uniref:Uncharacterized protein n=1 Tax=Candidatus Kentrum sp. LPFa TaxID=2126335 RepID=A0A450XUV3_9GAMM|nr:MAG: hypothetical protein BECKLPF1236A_GA0070988_102013 [Candidatus Kentron sp. LPFa]VFK33080.1 MAG: hypothetical protein BECKLPF1236C_GA0070990_101913 [Candidatus Kentron sp. LPFa]
MGGQVKPRMTTLARLRPKPMNHRSYASQRTIHLAKFRWSAGKKRVSKVEELFQVDGNTSVIDASQFFLWSRIHEFRLTLDASS